MTMINTSFLAYLPDPFGVRNSYFCQLMDIGECRHLSASEVSELDGYLVTYESASLVDDLRRLGFPPPNQIIDFGAAIRLCVGSSKDNGGERRWNVWKNLSNHFPDHAASQKFKEVFQSRSSWPDEREVRTRLEVAVKAVQMLWADVSQRLEETEELQRFLKVEVPTQGIFNYRQYTGIPINSDVAKGLISKVSDEKYNAYQAVATALAISPTGLNFWNIQKYLASTDAAHLSNVEDGGKLREYFKIAAVESKFANDFLTYDNASRDELILRRAVGSEGRLYPIIETMGTVSGRILVSDPYLQQLRRSYRGIISSEMSKQLSYLDYCQFEPGILAQLSGDPKLIQAYNDGDLYLALSEAIFGDKEHRPISKRIFLAFCYGMSADGIAGLIVANAQEESLLDYRDKVEAFFSTFTGLNHYRIYMEEKLERDGFVSSLMGNKRYRTLTGHLSRKEKRWALNQPIQATASLIFKEALVKLAKKFGKESILLPVHDAVLMQFDSDDGFALKEAAAKKIMIEAFQCYCPDIKVKVSAVPFL